MASIVAAVFKATIGLLVNKGRKLAADKLKEGDVTDEQFRHFIVREIDDIKSKLDGLARTNLLASICFFKEGLVYLYKVLDLKTIEQDGKLKEHEAERKEKNPDAASSKTVSLADEMCCLQVTEQNVFTKKALASAKDRFKRAREKATEAFCNEALSTSDRILSMQYRVMATLLEEADNPAEALAACRLCLEELHSMPAVQKSFNVQLNQGFKSRFNRAERGEIIYSVCRVNRVIFHVTQMVCRDVDLSLWPCVDIGEEKVDPLRDKRVTESLQEQDTEQCLLKPWSLVGEGEEEEEEEKRQKSYRPITTNTQGQFIIAENINEVLYLRVFDRTGNHFQTYRLLLPVKERDDSVWSIEDIDTDRDNNIFILVNWEGVEENWRRYVSTVYKFDEYVNLQHEFNLKVWGCGVRMTVSDNNKVFVLAGMLDEVHVYDTNGLFLNSFGAGILKFAKDIAATNSAGSTIVTVLDDRENELCIHGFSERGDHLSQIDRKRESSDKFRMCLRSIAFHRRNELFVVLQTEFRFRPGYRYPRMLYVYNEDGKFVRSIHLNAELLMSHYEGLQVPTVTKEGLVAMLAIHKRTGKRMIVIL